MMAAVSLLCVFCALGKSQASSLLDALPRRTSFRQGAIFLLISECVLFGNKIQLCLPSSQTTRAFRLFVTR
jgi:hypothetical protein